MKINSEKTQKTINLVCRVRFYLGAETLTSQKAMANC
jgi:hypothetical protein